MNTEESDDFSRAEFSGDKQRFKVKKGKMFESQEESRDFEREVEGTRFFKTLNELFSPSKKLNQGQLIDVIKDKYGVLLQSEDLITLRTQIEIILGLPKN